MPRTSRTPLRRALPALILGVTIVSGCGDGGSEEPRSAAGGSAADSAQDDATRRVAAAGVSFEVPQGYTALDAEDVAGGMGGEVVDEFADRLGVSAEQFGAMVGSVDLLLFSDGGAQQGFLDNISVVRVAGEEPPSPDLMKRQLLQVGADIQQVESVEAEVGEVLVADYLLSVGELSVAGRSISVPLDPGVATITLSAVDPEVTDTLGDRIVATLEAD